MERTGLLVLSVVVGLVVGQQPTCRGEGLTWTSS